MAARSDDMTSLAKGKAYATWTVLGSMALFAATSNVVFGSIGRVGASFHVSPDIFSIAVSVQFLGFFFVSLFLGILSDRVGKKGMLVGAGLAAALGSVGWMLSPSISSLLLGLAGRLHVNCGMETLALASIGTGALLLGAAGGVMESIGSAIIADLHPDRGKFYMNVSQIAYCVGAIVPTVAMGWIYPMGVRWQCVFAVLALFSLLMTMVALPLSLPHESQGRKGHGDFSSTMRVLPSVAIPAASCFCYVFPEMATATFLGIYLKEHLHAPEGMSIYCLPMFWTAVVLGRMACAFIPQKQKYEYVIAPLMLAASLTVAGQLFVSSWKASMCLFVLTGLAFSGTWPLIVSLASARNREDSGAAAGITISCGSMGCVLHPLVIGPLFHGGHTRAAFLTMSGMLMVGAALMCVSLFVGRRRDNGGPGA